MTNNVLPQPTLTRREVLVAGSLLPFGWTRSSSAAQVKEEIIDIHAHIVSSDSNHYPVAPLGGTESDWARTRPVSFEQYVTQANAAGISKAAFVQPSTYYGVNNSYLVDAIARDPKRFTGVCSIDTVRSDAVQVLDRLMQQGVTGLRLFTAGAEKDLLIDPRGTAVWEEAAKRHLTICASIQALLFPQLRSLVQRFPQVKVVLDHGTLIKVEDGPPYTEADSFFEMAQFRNFFIKLTPATFAHARLGRATPDTFFPKLVAVFGADHLAFGSNLPSTAGTLTQLVAEARECFASLSAPDRYMIFAGTAKTLYPALD